MSCYDLRLQTTQLDFSPAYHEKEKLRRIHQPGGALLALRTVTAVFTGRVLT